MAKLMVTMIKQSISKRSIVGPGDTLGCHIFLPSRDVMSDDRPLPASEDQAGGTSLQREEKDLSADVKPEAEGRSNILTGSSIHFFKNGQDLGPAFVDIPEGTYYPAASLYMSACVTFNFGPTFKHPPVIDMGLLFLLCPFPNASLYFFLFRNNICCPNHRNRV